MSVCRASRPPSYCGGGSQGREGALTASCRADIHPTSCLWPLSHHLIQQPRPNTPPTSLSRVQLCNPMDCSPPGFSVYSKNTGVGCHCFLQGIFPTQGSNPGLLHHRWILYCLSHQGSLYYLHSLQKQLQESKAGGSFQGPV